MLIISNNSPRRAWLFAPGDQQKKLEKIAQIAVDCVIFDWEDAVAAARKDEARQLVTTAVTTLNFPHSQCFIRVNAPDTPFFADDLAAIANLDIDGIILPKIEMADHLCQALELLPNTAVPLYALIETALAIMNLKEIAQATPRLAGLMFGAEDLTADLGATPSSDKSELLYARSAIVTAAAAYNLEAIDTVYTDFHNLIGLENESRFARQMGCSGKMAIHPKQIETIQRVFSPTPNEISQAQEIIAAYKAHLAAGEGVFVVNGRMVDKPIIRAAQQILTHASQNSLESPQ